MSSDEKYRVWDSYWQDSRLLGIGPDRNADVAARFDAQWTEATAALPDGARILDLACGNGYVALVAAWAARAAGKTVKIDAIDAAAIDPKRYLTQHTELVRTVNFRGRALMEALPFDPASFDAIFSQFGIEFGTLDKASAEVGRVLKPGGVISMLSLAAGTGLVEQVARTAKQSQHVLTNTKLFDVAAAVAQAIHIFETTGEGREPPQYLAKFSTEVERVMTKLDDADVGSATAIIATLQDVLTNRKTMDIKAQLAAITTLKARLTGHAARSEAVVRSALGDATLSGLVRRLTDAGICGLRTEPWAVGDYGTVAWRIAVQV